jgi:hypothetical protein
MNTPDNEPVQNPDSASPAATPAEAPVTPAVPPAMPETAEAVADDTVGMCRWWMVEKCGLSEDEAKTFLEGLTMNDVLPLGERRFNVMYKAESRKRGNSFPAAKLSTIVAEYKAAHPEPVAPAAPVEADPAATDTATDVTDDYVNAAPSGTVIDPNAPAVPDNATTEPSGTPAAPADGNGTAAADAPDANNPSTPNTPVIPPAPVSQDPESHKGRNMFAIAAACGLAIAGAMGIFKAESCNAQGDEPASAGQGVAPQDTAGTPSVTATASASTAPITPKGPSWIAQNKPESVWIKCDNEGVPTNCQLPTECRQMRTSLSQKVKVLCRDAEENQFVYATERSAEAVYPHGSNVEIKFHLVEEEK